MFKEDNGRNAIEVKSLEFAAKEKLEIVLSAPV